MIRKSFLLIAAALLVVSCSGDGPADLMNDARALEEEGNSSEALTMYETVYKQHGESDVAPEALFRSAAIYYNTQDDPLKAATAYELVSEKYPESEFAHRGLFIAGFTYANELKNLERAKKAYERYLAAYSDSSMADAVRFELQHLGTSPEDVLKALQDAPPPPPTAEN